MGAQQELIATFTNVGTTFAGSSQAVSGPAKYQIHRARALLVSGTGTSVALRVRQKDDAKETKLQYSLTATEIDSIETQDNIVIHTKERTNNNGNTYIAVKVNSGSDTEVYVALDIEIIE